MKRKKEFKSFIESFDQLQSNLKIVILIIIILGVVYTAIKAFNRPPKIPQKDIDNVASTYLEQGKSLYKTQDYPKAQAEFQKVAAEKSETKTNKILQAQAKYWIGMCQENSDRRQESRQFYQQAIDIHPLPEVYLRLSWFYIRDYEISKAKQQIEKAIELKANVQQSSAILAVCGVIEDQESAVREYYKKTASEHAFFRFIEGYLALKEDNAVTAKEKLLPYVQDYFLEVYTAILLAEVGILDKDFRGSEQILLQIQQRDPSYIVDYSLMKLYFHFGDKQKAIQKADLLAKKIQNDSKSVEKIVELLLENTYEERAFQIAIAQINSYPESIPLYLIIAEYSLQNNDIPTTEKYCRLALSYAKEPRIIARFHHILGDMHLQNRDENQALFYYQKAIQDVPDYLPAYHSLVQLLFLLKKYPTAHKMIRRGLLIDAADIELHVQSINLLMAEKRWEEALEFAEKTLQLDPQHVIVRTHMATIYHKIGEEKKAERLYRTIVKDSPNDAGIAAMNLSSILFLRNKDLPYAARLAYTAYLQTKADKSLELLSAITYRLKKPNFAKKIFSKLVEKLPEDPEVRYQFGIVAMRFGDRNTAVTQFRYIIHNTPKSPKAIAAQELMDKLYQK